MHGKSFKFIYSFAKSYKKNFVIILVTILITTYIVAMYPHLYGKMVDTLFYKGNISEFMRYISIYFLIFILNQFLHFVLDMTTVRTRMKLLTDIKQHIFRKVMSYKGSLLANIKTGDIIYRMNHDAEEFMNLIYSDIFYGISALFDLILCIVMTLRINILLSILSVVLAALTFVIGKYVTDLVKKVRKLLVSNLAENQTWLFEILRCMRDVRLMSATKKVINKYLKKDIRAIRLGIVTTKYEVISERSNAGIQVFCTICLYSVSALFMVKGLMTLGGMVACIDYFERILLMLNRISKRSLTIPNRLVAIERVMAVDENAVEDDCKALPQRRISKGEIYINNLWFSYNDENYILKDICLHIKAGEKIALTGKSGEGKSTLAYLICRLYDINKGEIIIDGIPINKYHLHDLRSQIAIAYQDALLFENSIRYNLIFSENTDRDAEIWTVLERVELNAFIKQMPEGLNTKIATTERSLSGGQKQRIEIARLLLKRSRIIIFDESTSHLDRETEQDILDSWDTLLKGHTIIIITHRLETIVNVDRVVYMENGEIAGCNKHEKLLKECEGYAQLFQEQCEWKKDRNEKNQK